MNPARIGLVRRATHPAAELINLVETTTIGPMPDPPRAARRAFARLLPVFVVLSLAVPLFAHGCHRGDHDDEPSVAPPALPRDPR